MSGVAAEMRAGRSRRCKLRPSIVRRVFSLPSPPLLDAGLGLSMATLVVVGGVTEVGVGVAALVALAAVLGRTGVDTAERICDEEENPARRDVAPPHPDSPVCGTPVTIADFVQALPSAVMLCEEGGRVLALSPRLRGLLPDSAPSGSSEAWLSPPGVLADACRDGAPPTPAELVRAGAPSLPVTLRAARAPGDAGWLVDVQEHGPGSSARAAALPPAAPSSAGPWLPWLLRASPLAVVLTRRLDGRVVDANEAFARLVQRPHASIVGATEVDLGMWVSEAEREEVLRCVGPGDVRPLVLPDGTTRTVRLWCHPLADGDDAFLLSFVADDEERARAEQDLAAERDFTQTILDTSGQGIVIADREDRLLYVNAAFSDLVGVDAETLIGRPVGEFVAPDDLATYEAELARRREGQRGLYETSLLHRSGQRRHVLVTAIPHPVDRIGGSVALLTDLTLIRQAYDEAERQRVFYEDIVQRLPIRLALADRQWRFRFANVASAPDDRMRAAAIGRTYEEVAALVGIPDEQIANFRVARERMLATMQPVEWTEEVLEPGEHGERDRTVLLLQRLEPLHDAHGALLGYLGVAVDITERKRYEASLLAAKVEAEQLACAKSAFLANMSHEVRTPLAGIIGFAEVLAEELDGAQKEAVELIRQSGMRLLETLNSVLDFARLEADALALTFDLVDLGAEVRAAAALFRPLASARGVALEVDLPEAPLHVRADSAALHRVLVNLISNAVKFTEVGKVRISVGEDGSGSFVTIADTGAGIDAAFLPHLFEEFRQESAGLTRSHEGSGLGLSITRRLVELMRGRIDVTSAKGEGSVFTVRLPSA